MRGCNKDAATTVAAFAPGCWLRTGDLGHGDADGRYFVAELPRGPAGEAQRIERLESSPAQNPWQNSPRNPPPTR